MSKKTINIIYIFLILIACSCIIVFFFEWNSVSTVKNQLSGSLLKHFHVDVCEINKHKVYLSGWAFIHNQDHSITRVYAEIQNGDLLPLASNSVLREDISKLFGEGNKYWYAGFQASKRLIYKENLTKKIFIVTQGENKKSYVAQYVCQ